MGKNIPTRIIKGYRQTLWPGDPRNAFFTDVNTSMVAFGLAGPDGTLLATAQEIVDIKSPVSAAIGDGVTTVFDVQHDFALAAGAFPLVQVRETVSGRQVTAFDSAKLDANTERLTFVIPPTTDQYTVEVRR